MTVHLIKLSAGAESVDDLRRWVDRRVARNARGPLGPVHDHVTRLFPRRQAELTAGGSLYWVIKGVIRLRQRLLGFRAATGEDGIERCAILLDPRLVETEAQPRRAFQGWRYLRNEDAPADLGEGSARTPPVLRATLAELGLL